MAEIREEMERRSTLPGITPPDTGGGFDFGTGTGLQKDLQDRLVAMTKTAVDDMQLEYDRLEAHIIEVDGAISASWQKVLDGRQADIAAVGLAEQFPALAIIEDMEKAVAKADQLEASLGRGFDLVSAKVGIFRSALEEMIDLGLGPANEEYEKTLDGLKRLLIVQGKMAEGVADLSTELSFFEGLKDQAKGILDPSAIASSALGNLLSGGVSSIVSSLFSGIGGLFRGPDETALDRNSEALIELQTGLRELSDALFRSTPGGLISGLQEGLTAAFAVIDERNVRNPTEAGVDLINQTMADLGLTFEETRELALGFGIELEKSVPSFRQFLDALREADLGKFFDGFSGQMNLAQRRFDLFDIQAPAEKLSVLQDLFERFTNLPAPTNTEALLELFEQFASGGIKFGDLDKLTGSQFLDMLSDMEGLFDDLGDSAKGANAALRNVPAGFKVAAARFRATDPESFAPPEPPPILPPITPPPPLPPDDALREIMDALTGSGGVGDTITDALAGLNDLGTVKDALAGGLNDSSGLGTMKDMLAGRLNDSSGLAGGNMTDRLGLGGGASDQPVTNNYIFQGDINLPDVQDPDEFLLQIEQQARWRGRTGGGVLETNEQR